MHGVYSCGRLCLIMTGLNLRLLRFDSNGICNRSLISPGRSIAQRFLSTIIIVVRESR